jgi:ABC-type multidrug transport system ATPase subunit
VAIMHAGHIVAMDRPAELLAGLGRELLELRVDGDAGDAFRVLRRGGVAGDTAFAVGSTVTLPLNGKTAAETIAATRHLGVEAAAFSAREPTLDDVYLRLTGDRLGQAA